MTSRQVECLDISSTFLGRKERHAKFWKVKQEVVSWYACYLVSLI